MSLFRRKQKKVREKIYVHLGVQASPSVKLSTDHESGETAWKGVVEYAPAVELPGRGWVIIHDGRWVSNYYGPALPWYYHNFVAVRGNTDEKIYGIPADVLQIWNTFTFTFRVDIPLSDATDSETAMNILRGAALEEMGRRRNFWNKSSEVLLKEHPYPIQLSGIMEVEK